MILIFGGTTEGRKAAAVLEEAGSPYYYSTKTGEQEITLQHGHRIDGALDAAGMMAFCREHDIKLIVDAAHPFALQLHQTIIYIAEKLQLTVVRYERIYPPRDADILWIDDYSQIPHDINSLLATTGVQTIAKLKPLEASGIQIFYRILPRESSIALAHKQGANDAQLCFYEEGENERKILESIKPDALLLKESGRSGGFIEKIEAARSLGIRIIAIKRPKIPFTHQVNGPYGLRRIVEQLLPDFFPLHSGLTTGTCATAAAIAATIKLIKGETPTTVNVVLPNGETIPVKVNYGDNYAFVIKSSGDDPDVTDGLEIRAKVEYGHGDIIGGDGVGTITLPGFDFPPGSPAINQGPRAMIQQNLSLLASESSFDVTISVPEGRAIASRTFNPRLGIEGGISIIGVSGIVKPFSEDAFIESIRKCMNIAKASGAPRVVINSGGKSERFVKTLYPDLPQQAFVEYGNYIGETLKIADELDIKEVTLGVMLGKAVKLAAGHLDTHSKRATMDKSFIQHMLHESNCDIDINPITLAREIWTLLTPTQTKDFAHTIIRHCEIHCKPLLPKGTLTILLIDDEGNIFES